MTDGERAAAFLSETYRRRVERVERFPWGELVVTPSLPLVYDANFAIVTRLGRDGRLRSGRRWTGCRPQRASRTARR